MDVYSPLSLGHALGLLAAHDALPAAGCTDLLVNIKRGKIVKKAIVDITGIPELARICRTDQGVTLGGAATFSRLEDQFLGTPYACLSQAAAQVGAPQIRNRGTIAGNVVSGSPASDGSVALLALDAELTLEKAAGCRMLPIAEFFRGYAATALEPGELITRIHIAPRRGSSAFVKLGKRNALAISIVSLAIYLEMDGDTVTHVAVALGSAAPIPMRASRTEAFLRGQILQQDIIRQAAQLLSEELQPISDLRGSAEYRLAVARELFSDLLERRLK